MVGQICLTCGDRLCQNYDSSVFLAKGGVTALEKSIVEIFLQAALGGAVIGAIVWAVQRAFGWSKPVETYRARVEPKLSKQDGTAEPGSQGSPPPSSLE